MELYRKTKNPYFNRKHLCSNEALLATNIQKLRSDMIGMFMPAIINLRELVEKTVFNHSQSITRRVFRKTVRPFSGSPDFNCDDHAISKPTFEITNRKSLQISHIFTLTAILTIGSQTIADAADMAHSGHSGAKRKPDAEIVDVYVPPPPPPKWTGFYGGINLGAGWGASSYSWNTWYEDGLYGGLSNNLRYGSGISLGLLGGAQVGYNYEIPGLKVAGKGFLAGVETDFQGTTMGGNSTRNGWLVNVNNGRTSFIPTQVNGPLYVTGFGTVRGRFGVLLAPTFLVYGTGGFAYAGLSRSGAGFNFATVQTGWTAGAGMEFLLSPSLSMKMEYLYANVGGTLPKYLNNYGPAIYPVGNKSAWNSVRLGLNYHLNFNPFPLILNVNLGQNENPPPPKPSSVISSKY